MLQFTINGLARSACLSNSTQNLPIQHWKRRKIKTRTKKGQSLRKRRSAVKSTKKASGVKTVRLPDSGSTIDDLINGRISFVPDIDNFVLWL